MKKIIATLLITTAMVHLNACGGYFDDGSRALRLHNFIRNADVKSAKKLLETNTSVAKEMRFQFKDEDSYKSAVGAALELGWRAR